jgi:uncharacterized protein YerC
MLAGAGAEPSIIPIQMLLADLVVAAEVTVLLERLKTARLIRAGEQGEQGE